MFVKLWARIADFPSTNGRIMATIAIFWMTACRYMLSDVHVDVPGRYTLGFGPWEPNWEFCALIAAALGIDSAQYFAKRKTHKDAPPANPDVEDLPGPPPVPQQGD